MENGNVESRLEVIEASLGRIDHFGARKLEADRAINTKIEQIAKAADVPVEQVEKVLNQLALPGLIDNILETSGPRQILDEGRLALTIYAHRKIISA